MVEIFLWNIQKHSIRHNVENTMIWSGTRNGKFFIKALYSYLDSGGAKAFPTRVIWNPWVPLRVGLFAW